MKFVTQDYYEILDVGPGASSEEVKRAYRLVRQSFRPDSMAIHSLYTPEETEAITAKMEEAFRILSDAELARRYAKYHRTGRVGVSVPRDPEVFFDAVHDLDGPSPIEQLARQLGRMSPERPRADRVVEEPVPTADRSLPPEPRFPRVAVEEEAPLATSSLRSVRPVTPTAQAPAVRPPPLELTPVVGFASPPLETTLEAPVAVPSFDSLDALPELPEEAVAGPLSGDGPIGAALAAWPEDGGDGEDADAAWDGAYAPEPGEDSVYTPDDADAESWGGADEAWDDAEEASDDADDAHAASTHAAVAPVRAVATVDVQANTASWESERPALKASRESERSAEVRRETERSAEVRREAERPALAPRESERAAEVRREAERPALAQRESERPAAARPMARAAVSPAPAALRPVAPAPTAAPATSPALVPAARAGSPAPVARADGRNAPSTTSASSRVDPTTTPLPGARVPAPHGDQTTLASVAAVALPRRGWSRDTVRQRAVGLLDLTPLPRETLDAIEMDCGGMNGSFLQAARREMGVAIADIADRTKIAEAMLRSIEADDAAELPPRVYLKGYLTHIARLLHLPVQPFVDGYLRHHRLG